MTNRVIAGLNFSKWYAAQEANLMSKLRELAAKQGLADFLQKTTGLKPVVNFTGFPEIKFYAPDAEVRAAAIQSALEKQGFVFKVIKDPFTQGRTHGTCSRSVIPKLGVYIYIKDGSLTVSFHSTAEVPRRFDRSRRF